MTRSYSPVQLAWGMQHDATDDPVDVTNIVIVIRPIAAARLLLARTKVRAALTVMRNLDQGVEPAPLSPSEIDAMIRREIALNLKIAKEAGLKFN
jgi:hypothetical protein